MEISVEVTSITPSGSFWVKVRNEHGQVCKAWGESFARAQERAVKKLWTLTKETEKDSE